jgi:hypothetical protein
MRRMPQLAVPFAVVGAAAGWLSVAFFSNPIVALTLPNKRLAGVVVSAVAAGLVGRYVSLRCAPTPDEPDEPDEIAALRSPSAEGRLAAAMIAGGAAAGSVIGAIAAPSPDRIGYGFGAGASAGAVAAFVFLPLAGLVLRAARRSVRARHGSIVAAIDARSVIGVLAGALAVMTLLALPDWPAARTVGGTYPEVALAIAAACALVGGAVLAVDAIALRRLAAATARARTMEAVDDDPPLASTQESLDVGVGEARRATVVRGDAYRARSRAVAMLRGDPEAANRIARSAVGRGALAVLAAFGVLGLHARAFERDLASMFADELCERGRASACIAAAGLSNDELGREDVGRRLGETACRRHDAQGCAAGAERAEHAGDVAAAIDAHRQACKDHWRTSCKAVKRLRRQSPEPNDVPLFPGGPLPETSAPVYRALLAELCTRGPFGACLEARAATAPAEFEASAVLACEEGRVEYCLAIAAQVKTADPAWAAALALRACDVEFPNACNLAWEVLQTARWHDDTKLVDHLRARACEHDAETCWEPVVGGW